MLCRSKSATPRAGPSSGEGSPVTRRLARPSCATTVFAAVALFATTACQPYRIEYRPRPAFYDQATDHDLPDRVQLDDGTVIVYNEPGEQSSLEQTAADKNQFKLREKKDDGSIELHNILPEHVLVNAFTCLRNEEYALIYDQLLAEQTKMAYEAQNVTDPGSDRDSENAGKQAFIAYVKNNRNELGATLRRMLLGMQRMETIVESRNAGVIEMRLSPHVSSQFKFKRAYVVTEGFDLKLLTIR